jgi:hypothetical protein
VAAVFTPPPICFYVNKPSKLPSYFLRPPFDLLSRISPHIINTHCSMLAAAANTYRKSTVMEYSLQIQMNE